MKLGPGHWQQPCVVCSTMSQGLLLKWCWAIAITFTYSVLYTLSLAKKVKRILCKDDVLIRENKQISHKLIRKEFLVSKRSATRVCFCISFFFLMTLNKEREKNSEFTELQLHSSPYFTLKIIMTLVVK